MSNFYLWSIKWSRESGTEDLDSKFWSVSKMKEGLFNWVNFTNNP